MASIVVAGDTSGTVTLSAPAVSGTTTLTLPTTSGTVLTSASSVVSSQLPVGSVLQVVNAVTAVQVSANSGTYVDTGLTATITPSSASSKILVLVDQTGCGKATNDTTLQLKLLRGSTDLMWLERSGAWTASSAHNFIGSCSCNFLDSPGTTSAVTYKTQQASFNGGATVYTQFNVGSGLPTSTITLIEIKA